MFKESDIVLSAKHIVKQFPASGGRTLTACNDVNLNVYKGKTLGIVGESGCGKSTFVRMVISLDKPTSALDVTTQAQIVRQMMELRDDFGTGIIIVTHNIGVAAYMADQLVVMQHGKVVDQGTRDEVMNHPTSDYTKKLLAAVPEMEGQRYV